MNHPTAGAPGGAGWYEIHIQGHLDARWATWFGGMSLVGKPDGTTVLEGPVTDQAALHGLLGSLRDLGLPLLSLVRADAAAATSPPDLPTPGR